MRKSTLRDQWFRYANFVRFLQTEFTIPLPPTPQTALRGGGGAANKKNHVTTKTLQQSGISAEMQIINQNICKRIERHVAL